MVHVWCSERKIMKCDPVGINVTEKKKLRHRERRRTQKKVRGVKVEESNYQPPPHRLIQQGRVKVII